MHSRKTSRSVTRSRMKSTRTAQSAPSVAAAVGPAAWFVAIAKGAVEVMVLETDDDPVTTRRVLAHEIEVTRAVLRALGAGAHRLRLVTADLLAGCGLQCSSSRDVPGPQLFSVAGVKRDILERVMAVLSEAPEPGSKRVSLRAGSSFGEVCVDTSTCTLCLACARICPPDALAGDAASGSLHFTESACVQCGLCVAACPEQAIVLVPSLEPDAALRIAERIVHHAEIAPCTRCGKPFLPRVLLESSLARIGSPNPGNAEVARLLGVCSRCRSTATMREPFMGGKSETD